MGAVNDLPVLSILVGLPLVAGMVCLFVNANAARWIALVTTLVTLAIGVWLWIAYDPSGPQWQFVEHRDLGGGIAWALGIEGIALV